VGARVRVGARSVIHAQATLYPDVRVGQDCLLHSGVQVREACRLGDRVVVQNGAVIGADGFGFARDEDGHYHKIPQRGIVVVEDDVEIGALCAIDRAALGETRVGRGTKIDNLVQVGHSVTIGRDSVLAGQFARSRPRLHAAATTRPRSTPAAASSASSSPAMTSSESSVGSSASRPTKYRQRASSTPSVTACAYAATGSAESREGTSIASRLCHGTARANSAARSRTSVLSSRSGEPMPTATRTGPSTVGRTNV